jgi:hypothetical protein
VRGGGKPFKRPLTLPAYQGTFAGPGFLPGSTPLSSTTALVPGASRISGERKSAADIWGLRLGPSAEFAVFGVMRLSLSGGVAAGLVNGSFSWKREQAPAHQRGLADGLEAVCFWE